MPARQKKSTTVVATKLSKSRYSKYNDDNEDDDFYTEHTEDSLSTNSTDSEEERRPAKRSTSKKVSKTEPKVTKTPIKKEKELPPLDEEHKYLSEGIIKKAARMVRVQRMHKDVVHMLKVEFDRIMHELLSDAYILTEHSKRVRISHKDLFHAANRRFKLIMYPFPQFMNEFFSNTDSEYVDEEE